MTPFIVVVVLLAATLVQGIGEQIGDFHYTHSTDPMDDTDRSNIFTLAKDPGGRSGAVLMWKCLSDGLNVAYLFDTYMGGDSDDEVRVRYRVDQKKASDVLYWALAQSNEAAWMPMRYVEAFTEQARAGMKAVLRVTDPLDGETHTDEFGLNGLSVALGRLPCASGISGRETGANEQVESRSSADPVTWLRLSLRQLASWQALSLLGHKTYSANLADLGYVQLSDAVTLWINAADASGWNATASSTETPVVCTITYGTGSSTIAGQVAEQIVCR